MRYYEIIITDPLNPTGPKQAFTSFPNGQVDPGALDIIFDFTTVPFDAGFSAGGVFALQIMGVPVQTISNATNLNNKNVEIRGGFVKGLPLANPAQAGSLVKGFIIQAFGEWQGNDTSLDLFISPGWNPSQTPTSPMTTKQSTQPIPALNSSLGTNSTPINGVFSLPAGMQLATGIRNFFSTVLPNNPININISSNLIWPNSHWGVYKTVPQFAIAMKKLSKALNSTSNYPGVTITIDGSGTINVADGTVAPKNVTIDFKEMIGQPTWIEPGIIQFKCPLRADLQIQQNVTLPPGYYGISPTEPATPWNYRSKLAQQGIFTIKEVRHLGHYRQPDANSWVTVVTCSFVFLDTALSNG